MKRIAVLVCAVVLAACGGGDDGADTPRSVVERYLDASFDGRISHVFDLLHPAVQAKTTLDDFVLCAAKLDNEGITPKVSITEEIAVKYRRLDGVEVDATAVSVRLSNGSASANYTMWVVDGGIVDSRPTSDTPCVERW